MDGRMLARLGAVVFVAVAITATATEMIRKREAPAPWTRSTADADPPADPLRLGQRRCQQLGQAATSDPECLRVWSETRDRFLGRTSGPAAPQTIEGQ
ncbi:putative entry exclusion protein TrbK-alt [Agrobacterium vitis]|uniref:Conjugal transfer protein TrbK n=1 Tax=Agrobacterium vitis TaxID=373 RepID=A0A109CN73_AGRVI|nr:putative entry exclusion protein TrbK-alt [Agrobacterium vitis]KAA3513720.1 conjugal transfer protein TrbK [Agrobacterium vitis]KAA3528301.1 conjugal transfer protein TrbK [Agrobacterium vitis]MCM2467303.1 putative entry exclusion protein TrbK-alt [Agrobacterium vitis]MUO68792.1 putative entry exclusion protein TrbK-alt [Agrobacterium vitis]MUO79793.1 putative entry exclusion protein TrbK-alt [Agrobacterium vitis]